MKNVSTLTEHEEVHGEEDQQAASTGSMEGEKGSDKESLPQASSLDLGGLGTSEAAITAGQVAMNSWQVYLCQTSMR